MADCGPSGGIQTHDPVIPNHVRYQLRYAWMWSAKRDSNPQQPAWRAGALPLSYWHKFLFERPGICTLDVVVLASHAMRALSPILMDLGCVYNYGSGFACNPVPFYRPA